LLIYIVFISSHSNNMWHFFGTFLIPPPHPCDTLLFKITVFNTSMLGPTRLFYFQKFKKQCFKKQKYVWRFINSLRVSRIIWNEPYVLVLLLFITAFSFILLKKQDYTISNHKDRKFGEKMYSLQLSFLWCTFFGYKLLKK